MRRLGPLDHGAAESVLCEAFRDYPVMRYVLGDEHRSDPERLGRLVHLFVSARWLRDEPALGLFASDGLAGVALVSFPSGAVTPPQLQRLRDDTWTVLGEDARARYEELGALWQVFLPDAPHVHLNMIGIRAAWRRRGLGRRLLDAVHDLAARTPGAGGVSLTTEDPANMMLYAHVGYRVLGHAKVGPLETWVMYRDRGP